MWIAVVILWIASVVLHTVHYAKRASACPSLGRLYKGNYDIYGLLAAAVASGLLTRIIASADRTVKGAYAYYVNGARVSSGAISGSAAFVTWVAFTAVFNLSAMGMGYLFTKKKR